MAERRASPWLSIASVQAASIGALQRVALPLSDLAALPLMHAQDIMTGIVHECVSLTGVVVTTTSRSRRLLLSRPCVEALVFVHVHCCSRLRVHVGAMRTVGCMQGCMLKPWDAYSRSGTLTASSHAMETM